MKFDEIRTSVLIKDIDIFVCTETWLNDKHEESLFAIPGFNCFREDQRDRIGGGVAIWMKDFLQVQRYLLFAPTEIESLVIRLPSVNLILFAVYIPPKPATCAYDVINSFLQETLDKLLNDFPESDIFLCGDFNRFSVHDTCSSFNLINKFNQPTYGDNQLDYMLISEELRDIYNISTCCPFDLSKVSHASLLATPTRKVTMTHAILRKVYDLRLSNLNSFARVIESVDWSFIDDTHLTLNDKCSRFHAILNEAAMYTIPMSYVKSTPNDKPWITLTVKDLINKRWAAYRSRNFPLYNHLKRKVQEEIKKCKSMWSRKLQDKNVWKVVHAHKGTKSTDPLTSLMSDFKSLKDGADAINATFASIFLPETSSMIDLESYESPSDWSISITPEMVYNSIKCIPKFKASPDIPTALYKHVSISLAVPLCKLYNLSIQARTMPETWKSALICPVPKSSPARMNELRPISM